MTIKSGSVHPYHDGLRGVVEVEMSMRPEIGPDYAYAFLDFLGGRKTSEHEHLTVKQRLTHEWFREISERFRGFSHSYHVIALPYSDNISLGFASLYPEKCTSADDLWTLIFEIKHALWKCVESRLDPIRGGITVGAVQCLNGSISGPAHIEAFDIESKEASWPRVMLSERAMSAISTHRWSESFPLLMDESGACFVDYLIAYGMPPALLRMHKEVVEAFLSSAIGERQKEKGIRLAEYHNFAVQSHLIAGFKVGESAIDGVGVGEFKHPFGRGLHEAIRDKATRERPRA